MDDYLADLAPQLPGALQEQCTLPTGQYRVFKINLAELSKAITKDPSLPQLFLTPMENKKYASFKLFKRRIQWLGGRLAAKKAVLALTDSHAESQAYHDLSVVADTNGKPVVLGLDPQNKAIPCISITHSGDLALAMAVAEKNCGIDVQEVVPAITTITSRFMTVRENTLWGLDFFHHLDIKTVLTLFWSTKEAVRKASTMRHLPPLLELETTDIKKTGDKSYIFTVKHQTADRKKILSKVHAWHETTYVYALTLGA